MAPHRTRTARHRPLARSAPALLAALLAVLLLGTVAAPGASAATRRFDDATGDPGADITRTTVAWADALTVTVAHARDLADGDTYTAYVDTRPRRAGPEYKAFAKPNSDVLGLRRISSWNASGTGVRCPGLRVAADAFGGSDPVRFTVPGSCLGDPDGRVRVTVRFQRGSASDWAPAARRLGGSVKRY